MAAPPRPGSLGIKLWNAVTGTQVRLYRLTGGKVGGRWKRRNPILLLHHTGRRSGTVRVTPLVYTPEDDAMVVVASRGGSDSHPAWFHNLKATPSTTVELGRDEVPVTARVAEGEERDRLWQLAVDANPDYAEYATHTEREIPVVVLDRSA